MIMMMSVLLGTAIQTVPLPPAVWKERSRPDMPVLAPCDLGEGSIVTKTLAELPEGVAAEVLRGFGPAGISDAGGPFNSTDVVNPSVPARRFIRAYLVKGYWIIWYERGGFVSGPRTVALSRVRNGAADASAYRMMPGTVFTGDLCTATKAILAGVRSADTTS
jgi:hypothetical protein